MLGTAAAAAVAPISTTYFLPTGEAPERPRGVASEPLRVGVVGVRGRGRAHVGAFKKSPDAEVVAICDADQGVIGGAMQAAPKAKFYQDIRKMLEDESIDIVSIATPNHWHSLATIWALEAGKHVYVEKPISHNIHEGQAVVAAAKRHKRIVQHGTQARSQPATQEAMAWLHEGGLGEVEIARALCYKRRKSIGKVSQPQKPPKSMDFDLWTGPAALLPIRRKEIHYDWHWDFNTGNGDLGNQGVHQMDIARWGLGRGELPVEVVSCGGRLGYDDAGDTPNTLVTRFDYGKQQLIFEVRGLKTQGYRNTMIGVVFHCAEGYLVSASYGKVLAFDPEGKVIKTFRGAGSHFQNFLEAVRKEDSTHLNSDEKEGHLSASLCHMGNISYRLGKSQAIADSDSPFGDAMAANESFRRFRQHLKSQGLDGAAKYSMGPTLAFDPHKERFVGDHADAANALCTRAAREGFVVT